MTGSLGVCPVAQDMKHDGDNGGRAGGRVCWKVPISANGQESLKSCVDKACHQCAFYRRLRFEEEPLREGRHHLIVASHEVDQTDTTKEVIEVA